jgi:hypothetical protein
MAKTYLSKLYEKMEESRMDRLSDTSKRILAKRRKKQPKATKLRPVATTVVRSPATR